MKKIFLIPAILVLSLCAVFSQDADQFLSKINNLERVAGCKITPDLKPSAEYELFEQIERLQTVEVIKLFEETYNAIGRLYCYWALKERGYANCPIYAAYLKMKYTDLRIETQWYGEEILHEKFVNVVDYNAARLFAGKKQ